MLKLGMAEDTLSPLSEKVRLPIVRPPVKVPAETGVKAALKEREFPGAMVTGKAGRPETEKPVPETVIDGSVTELAEVVGFRTLNVSTELAPLPGRT
jgi:hypothetical protein